MMHPPASRFLLLVAILGFCSASSATLVQDEVEALKDIAKTLGKHNWNFSVDPCNKGTGNWGDSVECNCSDTNVCHITKITLTVQNLRGTLPPKLTNLPYLQEIDLSRNYLNGTIPKQWGSSLTLVKISLVGNRLTGPIPVELTNITTLQELLLENNQFYGNLPQELGNFSQIRRLLLSSNNFTGELPETLAKLTTLTDFRINDNLFSGQIPNFVQNWTNLTKLHIHGSGLSGPIPSEISFPKKLEELRISDLSGSESTFPQLKNLTSLLRLILRSCNINGSLPPYLGEMTNLKLLDLSYNQLSGEISSIFSPLRYVDYIYLTGNRLNGPVRDWIYKFDKIDLSYNNFSTGNIGEQKCQQPNVNLFASSSKGNNSVKCPKNPRYSLHINCGGVMVTSGHTAYDDDSAENGPVTFRQSRYWAFSNTGHFMDNTNKYRYIQSNNTRLDITDNAQLYTTARVSPISMTYYGFCLANGNYTVKLHFAEIVFTDNEAYSSLGRRVFDVYIQGKRVLKDFNIANEAGGVGKAVTKNFTATVTKSTLEIRFYWAGKGTTAIPHRSMYGPLISAISMESDNPPKNGSSFSAGTIIGIVAAVVIIIILVFALLYHLKQRSLLAKEEKTLLMQTSLFSLQQIKAATNNFDINNKIGEGGFGPVYKGIMSNGTMIAVKQLSSKSEQGNHEFLNEIVMISTLQHPCLVKLYGCSVEGDHLLLIYEYMENNSLARALFGPREYQIKLDWPTRHKICVGIAKGLAFLHEESILKIVHIDIKASNILFDKDFNPKISDFGLAKLNEEYNTHISTRIAGTCGYMAPEYAMHGYLTDKTDIYSFGVVTLEIISGRTNTIHGKKNQCRYLPDWAHLLKEKGNLMELVDRRLGSDFNKEEAMVMIKAALLCINVTATLRPTMSSVVSMLEGRAAVPEAIVESSEVLNDKKMEAMRMNSLQIENSKKSEIQEQIASMDGPWTASSSSTADLYPVHIDSSSWDERN